MKLASKISTQADGSDIVKEEDPASIVDSQRTVFISWFSGNLNVCIPWGGAVPVSSLSLGLLLFLKVLYVTNTVYERTTQSVYVVRRDWLESQDQSPLEPKQIKSRTT